MMTVSATCLDDFGHAIQMDTNIQMAYSKSGTVPTASILSMKKPLNEDYDERIEELTVYTCI